MNFPALNTPIKTSRGFTIAITEIAVSVHGRPYFMGDLLGKKGQTLSGGVIGRFTAEGEVTHVQHVNGRNVRAL